MHWFPRPSPTFTFEGASLLTLPVFSTLLFALNSFCADHKKSRRGWGEALETTLSQSIGNLLWISDFAHQVQFFLWYHAVIS